MKKENIIKYTSMGVLVSAVILAASKNTGVVEKNNSHIITNDSTCGMSISTPEGFHIEDDTTIVKNPKGLVNTTYVPEEGYHLQEYDYDSTLFYVVQDGYHLEGTTIVKNPKGLVNATYVPEEGYHLQEYDYDSTLFYVVQDGYHVENSYIVADGYHLEGTIIKKDFVEVGISRIKKLK